MNYIPNTEIHVLISTNFMSRNGTGSLYDAFVFGSEWCEVRPDALAHQHYLYVSCESAISCAHYL